MSHKKQNEHHLQSILIWFTGLSCSGKTTLAKGLKNLLVQNGVAAILLDGDQIRLGLSKDLGFSEKDRSENIRRVGEVSKLLVDNGYIVIGAFISPFQKDRDFLRALFDHNRFIEIYVDCDLNICEKRDIKGLYSRARKGEVKNFTGISSRYEIPDSPELHVNNGEGSKIEDIVNLIYNFIVKTNTI
jgi:adenylylsulfate kinase